MTTSIPPINITIAQRLKEVAELLHSQGNNTFRAQAYHHAARTLEQLEQPIDDLIPTKGVEELKTLPGIGESLGRAIRKLVLRGRLPMLERLRGEAEPESLLRFPESGENWPLASIMTWKSIHLKNRKRPLMMGGYDKREVLEKNAWPGLLPV